MAETLITLAVIGVVAALTIPGVVANHRQSEFKTGLKKAVSVLNEAISLSITLDGESPYDNEDLFNYLQRHMNATGKTKSVSGSALTQSGAWFRGGSNVAFYTVDGMRFEADDSRGTKQPDTPNVFKLHESDEYACFVTTQYREGSGFLGIEGNSYIKCGGCGSYGLDKNPNNTTKPPCIILVDVNGDRGPTPKDPDCSGDVCANNVNIYKYPGPNSKKVTDVFPVMITEDRAVPFGVVAQRAMYGAK